MLGIKEKIVFDMKRGDRILFKNTHKTFYIFGGVVSEGDVIEGTVVNVLENSVVLRVTDEFVRITLQEVLNKKVEILNILKN